VIRPAALYVFAVAALLAWQRGVLPLVLAQLVVGAALLGVIALLARGPVRTDG